MIRCEAREVRKGRFALGPLSLRIDRGVTTLVGLNGAGKTTLLRALVGLERRAAGAVSVGGFSPYRRREAQHVMRSVGYVPQEAGVPGTARVKDLLSYAAWLKGVPSRESVESIGAVLAELSIAELAQRKTGSLSGGERQRVSIAMALVHRLTVLILDEPTAGLDPVQRVLLRRTIDELAQQRAIVVSTHLVEDMGGHGDTVLVLHEGRIAFTGTPDELRAIARPEDVGVSTLERGSIGRTGRAQSGAHA